MRLRTMLKSKIHRVTVTGTELNYGGSITIDQVSRVTSAWVRPVRDRQQAWLAEWGAAQLRAVNARIAGIEQGAGTALIAVVDAKLCNASGRCVDVCPTGVIALDDVARVDKTRCNGCARCVAACPRGARR